MDKTKQPKLYKPFRLPAGSKKKFAVYVKKHERVKKVKFGDPNMEIKRDIKKNRDSFRARHRCSQKTDKSSPGYWSCRFWRAGKKVMEENRPLAHRTNTRAKNKMLDDRKRKWEKDWARDAEKYYKDKEDMDNFHKDREGGRGERYGESYDIPDEEFVHIIENLSDEGFESFLDILDEACSDRDIKMMKRVSRQNQLDREKLVGRPRAKSFGGKPDSKQDRRSSKKNLRDIREAAPSRLRSIVRGMEKAQRKQVRRSAEFDSARDPQGRHKAYKRTVQAKAQMNKLQGRLDTNLSDVKKVNEVNMPYVPVKMKARYNKTLNKVKAIFNGRRKALLKPEKVKSAADNNNLELYKKKNEIK